jgi:hypothetical protein
VEVAEGKADNQENHASSSRCTPFVVREWDKARHENGGIGHSAVEGCARIRIRHHSALRRSSQPRGRYQDLLCQFCSIRRLRDTGLAILASL